MRKKTYINNDWSFVSEFSEDFMLNGSGGKTVRLPHTCAEIEYNYCDEKAYQMVCGYRRNIGWSPDWEGRRVFITFEGAAHVATLFLNGEELKTHNCGYTAFSVELTGKLNVGGDNIVALKLDTRESCDAPPFGFVIDYLTYGGIYREVYIETVEHSFIADVYTTANEGYGKKACWRTDSELIIAGENELPEDASIAQTILTDDGGVISTRQFPVKAQAKAKCAFPKSIPVKEEECLTVAFSLEAPNVSLWSVDAPILYTVEYKLVSGGEVIDSKRTRIGFRKAEFHDDGFYLNGEKLKLRGLNRHQCYPYVGYAMPESMQKLDADILKNELGVNIVRTSHYPQSHHFIDRCDELGLLVFTEIPGWQHVGEGVWRDIVVDNTEEMVVQYRNHPSIILWGVRVNESQDYDEMYARSNAMAHALDGQRATTGVRYFEHSSLLEDVYSYNDFSFSGGNGPALRKKKDVITAAKKKTGEKAEYKKYRLQAANGRKLIDNRKKAYLVSEFNGHMFPTKSFDDEEHRYEHARRHAAVLESMYAQSDISGCIGWCMFDYNTHRDFGNGDRICYHGVMDMFRNPKMAASVYASQSDSINVCEMNSAMQMGEHPGSNLGELFVFTNADSIKLYKNDEFINEFTGCRKRYPNLPHPPVLIDDMIGDLLEKNEGYSPKIAKQIKECLMAAVSYGVTNLPLKYLLKLAKLFMVDGLRFTDGYTLYQKYIGNWGGAAPTYRIEAIKDGEVVKVIERKATTEIVVNAEADHTELAEGETYDVALVRIRIEDETGNRLPYFNEPLILKTEGAIELIGPEIISTKGGAFGTYVRTTGTEGSGKLIISGAQIPQTVIEFSATVK